jgi:hypothetical protein
LAEDLTEIDERLQHCWVELGRFKQSVMDFSDHGFATRWEQAGPFICVYATMLKLVPTSLRSQAGMILNEVRACLDSLACTLAIRARNETKQVYFPISKTKEVFETDGMKKIKKLKPEDQKKIINLKPYQGENHRLWHLHEADRIRKHTRLIMSGASGGGMGFGNGTMITSMFVNTAAPFFDDLNVEQKVAQIFHQGTAPIQIIFGMRYSEPPLYGARVEFVIEDSIQVATEIVRLFH